jgi:hypothetical protein
MGLQDEEGDLMVSAKEEPMWTLSTDSPRVMECLRRKALESGLFTFVFGCAPHGGHNLCMDWLKLPGIRHIVSTNVFIVNKINAVHLLTSMFDVCCMEKLSKTYALILFTKSRWCTALAMLKRNVLVKSVLISMPNAIDHDDKFEDVSMEESLREIILDAQHWKGTVAAVKLLTPLCAAITHLEGDEATFSAVWACFSHVAHHVLSIDQAVLDVLEVDRQTLLEFVHNRVATIYTPAHAIAFVTDPFYYSMRTKLVGLHGAAFLELGQGPLNQQCRIALIRIAGDNEDLKEKLLDQFAYFLSLRMEGTNILASRKLKPFYIWAQVDDRDMVDLARVLVRVHSNPAGAVGGERNHKTNNRVRTKQRVRLGTSKCEKQVAIAYNSSQLKRTLAKRRVDPYTAMLAETGSADQDVEVEPEQEEEDNIGQGEFRMDDEHNPGHILDRYLEDEFDEVVMEEGQV